MIVSTVHGDDGAGRQRNFSGDCDIMLLSIGNIGVGGQVPIVIEKQMKLNRSFGSAELSPREKGQTKGNCGTIQGEQLVLKPKFAILRSCHSANLKGVIKQVLKHLPRPMGVSVRIRKGRFVRCVFHSKMTKFSHGTG